MTSPPSLLALPEELLDHIISHLPRPALHALTLSSRTLNRLSTPHLYTHIVLTGTDFSYLRALALLLWTSPKHRVLVRSFTVCRAYGGDLRPWPVYEGLDELVRDLVEVYVRVGERDEWRERIGEGDAYAVAGLLLRSLPGVERMVFPGFEMVDPGYGNGHEAGGGT